MENKYPPGSGTVQYGYCRQESFLPVCVESTVETGTVRELGNLAMDVPISLLRMLTVSLQFVLCDGCLGQDDLSRAWWRHKQLEPSSACPIYLLGMLKDLTAVCPLR
ncbi:hypothetical protein BaRGS_00021174 [Batillaria attramentaria]|uniref:Uncharacterized protein n=1 Tax=Batillaria attramentaria TaxID=370345 RepID=A0ABD0KKB0_9CAEN